MDPRTRPSSTKLPVPPCLQRMLIRRQKEVVVCFSAFRHYERKPIPETLQVLLWRVGITQQQVPFLARSLGRTNALSLQRRYFLRLSFSAHWREATYETTNIDAVWLQGDTNVRLEHVSYEALNTPATGKAASFLWEKWKLLHDVKLQS